MSGNPLVSVLTPCYDCAATLPMAAASVFAQTLCDWEWIVIDDGSRDDTDGFVRGIGDPRVRHHRFPDNRGRAVARQFALRQAKGRYVCMLDGDDWMYPWRIERQVEILDKEPRLALLSAGMAIVDGENRLAGVRNPMTAHNGSIAVPPLQTLRTPRITFASSMIRTGAAITAGFDPSLRRAEDIAFLLALTRTHWFAAVPDIMYVYQEYLGANLPNLLEASRFSKHIYSLFKSDFPVRSRFMVMEQTAKALAYRIFYGAGLGSWLVGRRSAPPTAAQESEYAAARETVIKYRRQHFGTPELNGRHGGAVPAACVSRPTH